jgi:hypothetical protein
MSFQVLLSNDTVNYTPVLSMDVTILEPYNATLAEAVEILAGNTTNGNFNATIARYFKVS